MANGKTDREPGRQTVGTKGDRQPRSPTVGGKTDRERGFTAAGKGDLEKPSRSVSASYPRVGFNAITPPGTSSRSLSQKFSTKYTPGDYAAYRKAMVAKAPVKKPVQVVSNVVREKPTPTPAKAAAPARKAVSARTGDTTGVTTGKTTGTRSFTPGMATKTRQTAFGRQMANAMTRGNQPAGPMGGGGRGGSMGGGGASRSAGSSRTGGTRTNEPAGPKRY